MLTCNNAKARTLVGSSGVPLRNPSQSLYKLQYKNEAQFHITNTVYYLYLVLCILKLKTNVNKYNILPLLAMEHCLQLQICLNLHQK
jgi:hypothetical protein